MAKKRANGDGSIRKRKDGRWEGRYVVGHDPITGKMISRNVLGKTQAQVKEKLRTAIENSKRLDYTQTGKYTVGQWMDEWFEAYAKVKVRPSSHQTYKGYIENHIKPNIGDIPIEKLTSLQLQKFYRLLLTEGRVPRIESEKQPKGLSAKTVRNINQVISSAMDMAVRHKLILTNPTEGCELPKVEHREMKTLPAERLGAFLREAKESGVYELYYLDLATGLRRGGTAGPEVGGHRSAKRHHPCAPAGGAGGWRGEGAAAEDEEFLSEHQHLSGRGGDADRDGSPSEQRLCVPLIHRRSHLAGQREQHAAPGTEAGGTAQHPLP